MSRSRASFLLLAVITAAGCAPEAPSPQRLEAGPIELGRPAGSGEPNLHATPDGDALLTWLERVEGTRWALRLAIRRSGAWSDPITVRESDSFFVNWADFPSSVQMSGGEIAVHWLERVADAPYAYHVMLSISADGGGTWSEPVRAHDDSSPTEHGFVSMVPWGDGAAVTWLDGRAMAGAASMEGDDASSAEGGQGAMSIRTRTLLPDGRLGAEVLLDGRTCECCQTALARTTDGLVAAYRDRSPDEIRDIAVVRGRGETWSEPALVARHGWELRGCPVNGPQLSADGSRVAAVWYTGAGARPRVYAAFSTDAGATFGEPVRVDEGLPVGRVDVELLEDGSLVATWLEGKGGARVLARRIDPSGAAGPAVEVSRTSGDRSSGFPRMVRLDDELLVAWTIPGDEGGVRVRTLRLVS